jgi:hypothetical protein
MKPQVGKEPVDEAMLSYVGWREECAAVWDASDRRASTSELMPGTRSRPTALRSTERRARHRLVPTSSRASQPESQRSYANTCTTPRLDMTLRRGF